MIAGSFPPGDVAAVSLVRQSKRLYISAIPESMTQDELKEAITSLMEEHKLATEPGEAVTEAFVDSDHKFAWVEVSSTTRALLIL